MEFETWDRDTLIKEIQTEFEVLTQLPGELHYSNEKLLEKDIKDLQNIYFDLKRKTDKNFYPQYEKELDRAYEFNAPEYDADFISWSKHPTWEIDEAVALLLGKR